MNAVKLSAAADALLNFFMKFQSKVVLIGHNIKSFDCHLLLNALESCSKTDAFLHCIAGFVDTRLLFKMFNPNLKSFSQNSLFEQFVFSKYNAHEGILNLFSEPIVSNRVRVTKSQKVIASLNKYFASNVES